VSGRREQREAEQDEAQRGGRRHPRGVAGQRRAAAEQLIEARPIEHQQQQGDQTDRREQGGGALLHEASPRVGSIDREPQREPGRHDPDPGAYRHAARQDRAEHGDLEHPAGDREPADHHGGEAGDPADDGAAAGKPARRAIVVLLRHDATGAGVTPHARRHGALIRKL